MKTLLCFGLITFLAAETMAADLVSSNRLVVASKTAAGMSAAPILSRDGLTVTFLSRARDLTTNRLPGSDLHIFQYNRASSNIQLVSVASSNSSGAAGSYRSITVASNGNSVAFLSDAADLVGGDTNGAADVFLRDLSSGVTLLVSADTNGIAARRRSTDVGTTSAANPWSLNRAAQVSEDGRFVAFESAAEALVVQAPANVHGAVYLRDMQTGTTRLISRIPTEGQTDSRLLSMTPDATRVVILESGIPAAGPSALLVRNTANDELKQAAQLINDTPVAASISDDGSTVVIATATVEGGSRLLAWQPTSESLQTVASISAPGAFRFAISSNGQFVTYDNSTNVYRWNAVSQATELVTAAFNQATPAGGNSRLLSVDPAAAGIVFASDATNLVADMSNRSPRLYRRDMASSVTELIVSEAGSADASASVGTLLAFDTPAGNLVDPDSNGASDVFLHDTAAGNTTLISRAAVPGRASVTGGGQMRLFPGSVSSNGQYIAFAADDSMLRTGDTNGLTDAFLVNQLTGELLQAGSHTGSVRALTLSADGRFLVTVVDGPSQESIYRFDRAAQTEQLLATRPRRTAISAPAISPDGSEVAFVHASELVVTNLLTGTSLRRSASGISVLFADALFGPAGEIVYRYSGGIEIWNRTNVISMPLGLQSLSLALRGNYLAIADGPSLFRYDFARRTNELLHQLASPEMFSALSVTPDGRRITGSAGTQVFALDAATREFTVLSRTSGGTLGNGRSKDAQISIDGRYVVYTTKANNLVPNRAQPFTSALVVRDLLLGTTALLVANDDGKSPNDNVSMPVMSADGRTVAFQSSASDIVAGDYNDQRDIFVLKLGTPDNDADGMDDDWEVAYFGNLSRNGVADWDNDGTSDMQEFLAGTDPIASASVFRVMTLTSLGSTSKQIVWTGNPERNYRVEYKDDLGASAWTSISATPTWTGNTANVTDAASSANRFYRVVRLP